MSGAGSIGRIAELRRAYHAALQARVWGFEGASGRPSNADGSNRSSVDIARHMLSGAHAATLTPARIQEAGAVFAVETLNFLRDAMALLEHIRPGPWRLTTAQVSIGAYEQYRHLDEVGRILKANKELRATFGADYLITPDIVVVREPLSDETINAAGNLVGPEARPAANTPLRSVNTGGLPLLHASISCKWTIRSDRAQNTRTEALNLLRLRKGNAPHIVVVTGEPQPTRLASIALGTGDVDCVYHMALYELAAAVAATGNDAQQDMLNTLVDGRRLRDISDLPFDLAV